MDVDNDEYPDNYVGGDEEPELDCSYLIPENTLKEYGVRLITGDKAGSQWLVVGEQYLFHRNDSSLDGQQIYWECAKRKQTR